MAFGQNAPSCDSLNIVLNINKRSFGISTVHMHNYLGKTQKQHFHYPLQVLYKTEEKKYPDSVMTNVLIVMLSPKGCVISSWHFPLCAMLENSWLLAIWVCPVVC